jgi:hypothetical protein
MKVFRTLAWSGRKRQIVVTMLDLSKYVLNRVLPHIRGA